MEIISLVDYSKDKKNILAQVKDIFFESAVRKEFTTDEDRNDYFKKWCGVYWDNYSCSFYLAMEDDRLVGYLSGCKKSLDSLSVLKMPGYAEFSDEFDNFPAHYHINCHHAKRGLGVGSKLDDHFCNVLRSEGIGGVFIITAPMSRPTSFYMKKGFNHSYTREIGSASLIFMGKRL